jgi:hypothetical protein
MEKLQVNGFMLDLFISTMQYPIVNKKIFNAFLIHRILAYALGDTL